MEIIFISGCGRPKLMLPQVLKGSGEQMSGFYVLSLLGVPNHTSDLCVNLGIKLISCTQLHGVCSLKDEGVGSKVIVLLT